MEPILKAAEFTAAFSIVAAYLVNNSTEKICAIYHYPFSVLKFLKLCVGLFCPTFLFFEIKIVVQSIGTSIVRNVQSLFNCIYNTQVRHKSQFRPHYIVFTVAVEEALK